MFKIIRNTMFRSSISFSRFSNKGFNNFQRNKKPKGNEQSNNVKQQQNKSNQFTSQPEIQDIQKQSTHNIKGFDAFQQRVNKKPFDKQLFEKMKKIAQSKIQIDEQKSVHTNKDQKQQNSQNKKQYSYNFENQQDALKQKRVPKYKLYLLLLGAGLSLTSAVYLVYTIFFQHQTPQIIYSELVDQIHSGRVKQIVFVNDSANREQTYIKIRSLDGQFYTCKVQQVSLVADLVAEYNAQNSDQIHMHIQTNHNKYFDRKLMKNTMMLFVNIGLVIVFFRSMGSMKQTGPAAKNSSKSMFNTEQAYGKQKRIRKAINIKFKDVAGMATPKKQISQFVEFLKHPDKFKRLGARIPRGALLAGPPGTGKTLLAKACAGEAKVSFFSTSGSQFVQKFVGVGASRVRQLFKQAKQNAPSIIFIDQIDAVGRKRWKHAIGGNDERDSTLNQLLVQMDGFGTQQNVVVFAATNRKQMLDDALLRPGRFDRIIQIQLPDLEQRYQMFLVHLNPLQLALQKQTTSDIARRMAMLTPGFSGADIFNVCNEAAILAARNQKSFVQMDDFQNACDRIVAGTVKRNTLSEQQKRTVAYHQSGHGVVSWFLEGANPLLKLTIVPRSKGSLGFAQYLPSDKKIFTRQNMVDQIAVILGGRASQLQFFGKYTTGAADDLSKASQLAYSMIKQYGMGASLFNRNSSQTQYKKQYSQYTGSKIDQQVRTLISEGLSKAKEIIQTHKKKIQKLAILLLEKQTLTTGQIQLILGVRPFEPSESYRNFIEKA